MFSAFGGFVALVRADFSGEQMQTNRQDLDRVSRVHAKCSLPTVMVAFATLALAPCLAVPIAAQDSTTTVAGPNIQEFGIDAGMTVGLGSVSSFQLTVPAARARIGFFLPKSSRWELEPAASLSYIAVKNARGSLTYDVEAGLLYHLNPAYNVVKGTATVPYVRPFIGVNGVAGGGGSNADFSAGAGLGVKIPWREMIAFRLEANAGYGFSNDAFRLGAFAGVSVFTHHRVL
jgi:hypothetical protein